MSKPSTKQKRRVPPPGWVKNPRTLQDVIDSIWALGAIVAGHSLLPRGKTPKDVRLYTRRPGE